LLCYSWPMRKQFFSSSRCGQCGKSYDPTLQYCPSCGDKNPESGNERYKNFLHVGYVKEITFILLGLAGLNVIALFAQLLSILAYRPEDKTAFVYTGQSLFFTYAIAYPLLFLLMALVLWKDWRKVGDCFKKWKPYIGGIIGYAAIMLFSIVYSLIIQAIFSSIGLALPSDNANQTNVINMVLESPVACVFIIGIIGPFSEELCYRVGLFGLASRLGKWAGYLAGILIFALIHFDTSALTTQEGAITELVSLPNYLFSGACLCFLYDKLGLSASFTAHLINNVTSIVQIIVEYGGKQ
jgi:membrane protease YdiL (CAAX protease family)